VWLGCAAVSPSWLAFLGCLRRSAMAELLPRPPCLPACLPVRQAGRPPQQPPPLDDDGGGGRLRWLVLLCSCFVDAGVVIVVVVVVVAGSGAGSGAAGSEAVSGGAAGVAPTSASGARRAGLAWCLGSPSGSSGAADAGADADTGGGEELCCSGLGGTPSATGEGAEPLEITLLAPAGVSALSGVLPDKRASDAGSTGGSGRGRCCCGVSGPLL
jgi:hypothetical protein